jgi:2-polyprenyl-3-methyl-5-hydroxy-6-metoxy-1,4-benzoquinol methylase
MLKELQRALRSVCHLEPFREGENSWFYSGRIRYMLELFRVRLGTGTQTILDVGCSSGWFEQALAANPAVRIMGIEVDPAQVAIACARAPSAEVFQGSVLALPFGDETFDGAVMWEVIEHLPIGSEPAALREIARVLKHEAFLMLSTPHSHPLVNPFDPAWYFGHRHYTKKRLIQLLSDAGYLVTLIDVKGGVFEVFGILRFYVYKWILSAAVPPNTNADAEFAMDYPGFANVFVVARRP